MTGGFIYKWLVLSHCGGLKKCARYAREMIKRLTTDPITACYTIWIAWAVSWWLAAIWSSRAASRASIAEQLPYRLLTLAGFVLLFAINTRHGYHGPLQLWTLPAGAGWGMAALCFAGFAFAWWARIHLGQLWSAFVTRKADHRIVDTGPYRIVRHPIYTGIILAAIAVAIVKGTVFAIAGALLSALGFWIKARLEEGFLRDQLGTEAYDAYRRRVPMLVPFARA
jgi:protein-S-isoprenylcysteine O-methyltransferase Ste14